MKKLLCTVIVALGMMFFAQSPALAYDAGAVGTAGVATAIGLESLYESSVIARISGRAGASVANGAKGICFEVIYSDIQNAFYNIWNGSKTKLSASSIDDVADLIKTNKAGEIIQMIQCKDGTSPSQIKKILDQITTGKYSTADVVATKECAMLCNEKAASDGLSLVIKDSGVSTKTTTRIADKALGIRPSGTQTLHTAMKVGGLTAAVTACLSLAESIYNGEDIYSTTGSLIEDTSISAVSVTLATVASAELPAMLATLGMSAVAANTTAAVVAFIVPVAGGYALYILADECQFEEKIADGMESLAVALAPVFDAVKTKAETINGVGAETWNSIQAFGREAYNEAEELANSSVAMVTSWITGAEAQTT